MELVYLWVEDYKNIQKQGFNFSPRFRCDFDVNSNKLEIVDKDETGEFYPKNFFGENINITAIVGENGSGKSNLLELTFFPYQIQEEADNKYIAFFKKDKEIYSYCSFINNFIPILNAKFKHTIFQDDDITDKVNSKLISGLIRRFKNDRIDIKIRHTSQHFKGNMTYENSVIVKSLYLFSENNKINLKNKNINFDTLSITLNKLSLSNDIPNEINKVLKEYINNYKVQEKQKFIKKIESIEILLTKNILIALVDYYGYKDLSEEKHSFYNIFSEKFEDINLKLIYDYINPEIDSTIAFIVDLSIKLLVELEKHSFSIKVNGSNEIGYEVNFNIESNNSFLVGFIKEYQVFIRRLQEDYYEFQMLEIDLLREKNLKFSDFSEGEIKIYSTLVDIKYELLGNKNNYLFLLDEPDNLLHPNWVKEFIQTVLKNIGNTNACIKIILTSHSPFILSDLPKENVIFLEKDEKTGNCINASNKVDINPFGANIHTLLSHGFFMKDGLMGEFAKTKINDVINFLNGNESLITTNDEAQNIINIIGEPIIKRELQKKLDSKRLSKIDKIDEIEKQMKIMEEQRKLLEQRLESIRKNQR
jgi:predicted ATPase